MQYSSNRVLIQSLIFSLFPICVDRKGNDHFRAKDFLASIQCYSQAIAIDASDHVFFGNRRSAT